jgi:hypothetical protein
MSATTAQRVAHFMQQLADTESFPQHDRQHWLDVCSQPEFVEKMLAHIARHYDSADEGMCKLLNIVDSHLAEEFK